MELNSNSHLGFLSPHTFMWSDFLSLDISMNTLFLRRLFYYPRYVFIKRLDRTGECLSLLS